MNKHTRGQRIGCLICIASAGLMVLLTVAVVRYAATHLRPSEDAPDMTCPVVSAAAPRTVDIQGFCAPAKAAPDMTCPVGTVPVLRTYTDGDSPIPEWWNPDEPMAAVWSAEDINVPCNELATYLQSDTVDYNTRRDIGCPDWNLDTTLWGWDGHTAEVWEMDLFSRVFYLEFWGSSLPCCEAGCDAMLRVWDSGLYGQTLFEALSHYDPDYGYTYEVYPWVWETDFDADGLAWCREFCESRFYTGPQWSAMYFQLGGYHDPDWVTPAYEIDGVYFSIRED